MEELNVLSSMFPKEFVLICIEPTIKFELRFGIALAIFEIDKNLDCQKIPHIEI
jgi:hypothetical protein